MNDPYSLPLEARWAPASPMPKWSTSPLYCEHANEAPNICPCTPFCYCRLPGHTCNHDGLSEAYLQAFHRLVGQLPRFTSRVFTLEEIRAEVLRVEPTAHVHKNPAPPAPPKPPSLWQRRCRKDFWLSLVLLVQLSYFVTLVIRAGQRWTGTRRLAYDPVRLLDHSST